MTIQQTTPSQHPHQLLRNLEIEARAISRSYATLGHERDACRWLHYAESLHQAANAAATIMATTPDTPPRCIICGCTETDCHQCIAKTGHACHWLTHDLCSACVPLTP